jgi:hypothetical protein
VEAHCLITPGDIADRLTVLSIKMDRMPERQELKDQFSEAQAAWLQLRVNADAEMQALSDVNREAYDVVEMIYADFRDPEYGTGEWNLYPFYATMSRATLTIKNCRRAHDLNMERVRLKNEINRKAGAQQEVKSW